MDTPDGPDASAHDNMLFMMVDRSSVEFLDELATGLGMDRRWALGGVFR